MELQEIENVNEPARDMSEPNGKKKKLPENVQLVSKLCCKSSSISDVARFYNPRSNLSCK